MKRFVLLTVLFMMLVGCSRREAAEESAAKSNAQAPSTQVEKPREVSGDANKAQPAAPPNTAPSDAAPLEAAPLEAALTGEANAAMVAEAEKAIEEMIHAYQNAPVIVDRAILFRVVGDQVYPPVEYELQMGRGADVHLVDPDVRISAYDGKMYVTSNRSPRRYLVTDLRENICVTFQSTFERDFSGLFWGPLTMRYDRPREEIMRGLALGLPDDLRVLSYRTIEEDGRTIERITMLSSLGTMQLNIDPETKLLARLEIAEDLGVGGAMHLRRVDYHPQILDELPDPISFDPGDRFAVNTVRELTQIIGLERPEREPMDGSTAAPSSEDGSGGADGAGNNE